ncbi:MAG TPA: nodulation protein NfeD [Gammaproteobacteria bacterium]|nr:nodulation protein NfeD [Gammaproteobacteria bacterium]
MAASPSPASRFAILALAASAALGVARMLDAQDAPAGAARTATVLRVADAIGPATGDYVVRGIERAALGGSTLVVLELDTPGGLDTAMRDIIQAILASPIPVVVFVAPQGARAASAGTYILYASHVAAMAPATNLGAATPIQIGGAEPEDRGGGAAQGAADDAGGGGEARDGAPPATTAAPELSTASERKAVNDAVAYIRSLAEQRGRNADWAESAVRSAASLSARAALDEHVIDLIASDLDDLLAQLDGRTVKVAGAERVLATAGIAVKSVEPDWRTRLLAVVSNPTVAYILMLIGIYGLIFEGYNPGAVLPGVVGGISLLLALWAFQVLPVNYAGLALIALGVMLMIGEFFVPSFGSLGIGGIVAFVFGSVILIDADTPGFGVSRPLIGTIAAAGGAAVLGVIWLALRARRMPVVTGVEEMLRVEVTALEDFAAEGAVRAHGERWHARTRTPVHKGQRLRVMNVEGLVLDVEPHDQH